MTLKTNNTHKTMGRWSSKSFNVDIDSDLDDIFDEIDDDELIEEARKRKLITATDTSNAHAGDQFKRKLCDMLEIPYTSSKGTIISELTNKI